MSQIELPTVTRVSDGDYSHIEPQLDESWTPAQILAWQAAVLALDTGLHISLYSGDRRWADDTGYAFSVSGHGSGVGTNRMSLIEAHAYLMGVRHGVTATQREA